MIEIPPSISLRRSYLEIYNMTHIEPDDYYDFDHLDFFERCSAPELNIARGECLYKLMGTKFYLSFWPEDGFRQWRLIDYDYEERTYIDDASDLGDIFEEIPEVLKQSVMWHIDILENSKGE
jgi:hypothetical protein